MHIANGRYYQDQYKGLYTCHTSNGHSVVDYLLVDRKFSDKVLTNFEIGNMDILSDHCPVMFDIRVSSYQDNIQTLPEVEDYRFVWNTEQKSTYLNNLNRHIGDFDAALSIVTEEPLSRHTINEGITAFTKVLDITAEPFRRRIRSGHLSLRRNKLNHPPWWNAECGDKKRLFHRA
jgi:hypothetical protein